MFMITKVIPMPIIIPQSNLTAITDPTVATITTIGTLICAIIMFLAFAITVYLDLK